MLEFDGALRVAGRFVRLTCLWLIFSNGTKRILQSKRMKGSLTACVPGLSIYNSLYSEVIAKQYGTSPPCGRDLGLQAPIPEQSANSVLSPAKQGMIELCHLPSAAKRNINCSFLLLLLAVWQHLKGCMCKLIQALQARLLCLPSSNSCS